MDIKKVFFDTNIIMDIMDDSRLNHTQSKKLWKQMIINKSLIVISEDMLSTIFYLSKDKKYTLNFFKAIQEHWEIVPFGQNVISNAINVAIEKSIDLEDVLQCVCAKENRCKYLITNDKKFYNCGMKILTVDKFLEMK